MIADMKSSGLILIACGVILYVLRICRMYIAGVTPFDRVADGITGLFIAASVGFLNSIFQWF